MPMRVAPLSSMLARCGGEFPPARESFRQGVIAGADVLRRGARAVALLESVAEGADRVVVELVAAGHGLGLRLRHLHQRGIDGDRCQPVVGPVAGDHGRRRRGVDLRTRRRHAAIEARLAGRQFAVARAGAQQRQCRGRNETRAGAHEWLVESHAVPRFPYPARHAVTAWRKHGNRFASLSLIPGDHGSRGAAERRPAALSRTASRKRSSSWPTDRDRRCPPAVIPAPPRRHRRARP